jgi:DNA invertase Pin-like site-specific DNA recombinase
VKKFILYFRVSTKKQGDSGLGLDAQRTMVERFVTAEDQVLAEFTEIETGKNPRRPQLAAALSAAKQFGAILVVAKLDRLARNVAFTSSLMDSGVEFVACDCPYASRLTLHILAAVAEDEARRISDRTRQALAELKKDGVLLGGANPVIAEKIKGRTGWSNMDEKKREMLKAYTLQDSFGAALPMMRVLRGLGKSYSEIATTLNQQNYRTPEGCEFSKSTVYKVLQRAA